MMVLDLLSALPQLLTPAIAWAERLSQQVQREGECLNAEGLALAERVGVKRPELIRTMIFERLPLPTEPLLQQAALQTGLLGPEMTGLTLGHSILIVRGHMEPWLLSHECRHVHQYENYGSIAAFLAVYLRQIVEVGYLSAPLEKDARNHEVPP